MGAIASLSVSTVPVDPGHPATVEVRVRNTGTVVDEFALQILGDAQQWATAEPRVLPLFPGTDGVAVVRFDVPEDPSVGGEVPFAIRVVSKEDPDGSVVEEGLLVIGEFVNLFAEIVPRTSRGRRRAVHQIAVDNRGNHWVSAVLSATDPDGALSFNFNPRFLEAPPGKAVFARLRVAPRRRFWLGPSQTRPFQALVTPEGRTPLAIQGTYLQESVLPQWLPRAIAMALALLAVLAVLWAALLKPTVESAAKDAAQDEVQRAVAGGGGGGGNGGGGADNGGGGSGGGGAGAGAGLVSGSRFDRRLAVNTGATDDDTFTVPDGRSLSLTDIILQNPGGDTGILEIRRDDSVRLRVALANFRDLDYHFVTPVVFTEKQKVVLRVQCGNGGPNCTPSVLLSGTLAGSV